MNAVDPRELISLKEFASLIPSATCVGRPVHKNTARRRALRAGIQGFTIGRHYYYRRQDVPLLVRAVTAPVPLPKVTRGCKAAERQALRELAALGFDVETGG